MNEKRRALRTGVDAEYNPLTYFCPKCGWEISLMAKRCSNCGARRVRDAYERATKLTEERIREETKAEGAYIDRSADALPGPKAPCYGAPGTDDPSESCYATDALERLGIPKYYSSDEYGRVFETPVCYKPLPGAGPIPIPKPSSAIQTERIRVPVDIER